MEQRKLPQVPGNVSPVIEKAFETTTGIGINHSDTTQFSQNTNQSSEKTHHFFANTNRSSENASQLPENRNQSSEKTTWLFANTSRSSMSKNRSSQNTNQLIAKTRRSSENLSQSFENVIRSSRNTNRSSDNTNQLFENIIRSSENTNQLFENIIRSSENTNQLSDENLFHPECWQTKAKQLNQNSGSTFFKVNSETSKSYKNWHNRETSTRLDKGYESLKKEECYIDKEQTIGYPDFYVSHHEISSHMSETENPAINEKSGTEALDLVKRIPEDDLSSYLMEVDSHQIRPYSSQVEINQIKTFKFLFLAICIFKIVFYFFRWE